LKPYTKEELVSFNGTELFPGVILIRPSIKNYLTSSSLLFVDETTLIADSGFQHNTDQLKKTRKLFNPDVLFFSHFHLDHTFGCHTFPDSQKLIHQIERDALPTSELFIQFCYNGTIIPKNELAFWIKRFQNILKVENLSNWDDLHLNDVKAFKGNDIIDLGNFQLEIIHLPGHSPGHSGLFEPNNKILFIGDFDISKQLFAWYGWKNSNLPIFRKSVIQLRKFIEENDISLIIPSHSKPVQKQECLKRLDDFYTVFDKRKDKILEFLSKHKKGTSIEDIAQQSFIFQGKKSNPPFIWEYFEKIHIEEHVKELITEKSVCIDGNLITLN